MKNAISLVMVTFLILSSISINAQVKQRNLLGRFTIEEIKEKLLNKNEWKPFPKTPADWKRTVPDSSIKNIINQAKEYLKKPFNSIPATIELEYVINGNRDNYQKLSFEKRNQLFTLVVAESMEDKGRFSNAIANGIWNICEETYWGVPAHLNFQKIGSGLPDVSDPTLDLFGAETASVLALADYFTGEKMDNISPLIRERLYIEVNKKILNGFENEVNRYSYFANGKKTLPVNNWDPWITSNCITAFLLLEKNEDKRTRLLHHSFELLDLYINGLGDDGATDEGPSYWFAAGLALFDGLSMIENATAGKISIFKEPIIKNLGTYIYKMHIDNEYFVNVADGTPKIKADGLGIYRFGKAVNDTSMISFGAWAYHHITDNEPHLESFFRPRKIFNLLISKECAEVKGTPIITKDVWLPGIELMTARTNGNLYIASHGGHNAESHNHNDVGDFIIYSKGLPIIIDVGKGTYMAITFSKDRYTLWYNTSAYHNVPTINDNQQDAGADKKASNVIYKNTGSTTRFKMNIENAYPKKTGLQFWERSIDVNKLQDEVVIKDHYQFDTINNKLIQTFMTVCNTNIATPGKIVFFNNKNNPVVLTFDATEWTVTKEKMLLDQPHEQDLKRNWNNQTIWRLLLTNNYHKISGTFKYIIKQ